MGQDERTPPWYEGITGYQWLVFLIASAGWVFDVYEGQLFTIFKTSALGDLLGSGPTPGPEANRAIEWHANVALALFLVGGAIGGLGFGMLSDRFGRARIMSWTILVYSLFSALTYLVQTVWQLHALRFLVALGVGGEWAIAAALVAETFPPRARAFASGTFHALSVVGAGLASLTGMVLTRPGGWRLGFLLGLAPALLILWIRASLHEPEEWRKARKAAESPEGDWSETREDVPPKTAKLGSLSELLGDPRWRPRAWLGLALAAVGLGTYWGIFAWGPELAKEVLADRFSPEQVRAKASFAYLLMNFTGGLLGLLLFAPLASRLGRRPAFAIYHLGAVVMAPVAFHCARTYEQVLWLLPTMAFFVVGMHAGYAIYFPELFPTRLRATGASFCFNVGRLLGAGMLLLRGVLGAQLGLRNAVLAMSGLFLVGLVLLAFAPETRGSELPE
jgi:MFS family permease